MINNTILFTSSDARSQDGGAYPSDPRPLTGSPGGSFGRSYQPCPLVVHYRDLIRFFPLKALPSLISSSLRYPRLSPRLHRPEPRLVIPPDLLRSRGHLTLFQVLPQRDQQLAGQRDNPHLPQPCVASAKSPLVPLTQLAGRLVP